MAVGTTGSSTYLGLWAQLFISHPEAVITSLLVSTAEGGVSLINEAMRGLKRDALGLVTWRILRWEERMDHLGLGLQRMWPVFVNYNGVLTAREHNKQITNMFEEERQNLGYRPGLLERLFS